jgi:hypothetical protein
MDLRFASSPDERQMFARLWYRGALSRLHRSTRCGQAGDTIVARVATEATSNSRAGVMMRDSLANNSGIADMTLYSNAGGASFQYRPDGGSPNGVSGVGVAPYWVKITRSGNTFTGFVSPNGTTWTVVGSATLTMPSAIYVGLLQASGADGVLTISTFDNVLLTHLTRPSQGRTVENVFMLVYVPRL